jgi:predicted RNA-binding protein with TRAM domain
MPSALDSVRLLFETRLEEDGERYVVPIPKSLVEDGGLDPESRQRIALLTGGSTGEEESSNSVESDATTTHTGDDPTRSSNSDAMNTSLSGVDSSPDQSHHQHQSPPVEEGEIRSVTVDTLGDQGDGIARVERGFVIIIPDTKPGDEVEIRITDVKETVAFAETTGEATVR